MLHSHIAEAEEFLSTPFTALVERLQIYAELPADLNERSTLSTRLRALSHAEQYVSKGTVFDAHTRVTVKSGCIFLKLSNGRGWVAEQTAIGDKFVEPVTLEPCTDMFRVLTESLRIRLSASRTDVALSTRLLRLQKVPSLCFSDVFEANGCVVLGRDKYLRLKDGRGYVLAHDAGRALVAVVEPQRGLWMYKVAFEGGIGLRHVASREAAHRVAPADARQHPAILPCGTAVECDARVIKRIGEQLVAFARLSDGSGWIFSHAGAASLLELIAYDYQGGEADEDAARALQQQFDAEAAPAPLEEVEAVTALADEFPEPEPEPSAPELPVAASPARAPLQQRSVNMVSASPSPGTIEKVKVASANQYAADQYSAADDIEQIAVIGAVTTLNRLWPSALSA